MLATRTGRWGRWTAAVSMLFLCLGDVAGFVPMGAGIQWRTGLRSTEAAVSLQPRSAERARRLGRPSARRSMAVQAAPGETEAEVIVETLKQTVVVEASQEDCFQVASDLDSYRKWCAKGGMKKVEVLERNECGKASTVKMTAGKLGVDMLNTMEYTYDFPNQVTFKSIEGDVMKTLNGRYVFAPVEGKPSRTEVTYELALEFGFPLPSMVRSTICGAIMRTALSAFKSHTETLSK